MSDQFGKVLSSSFPWKVLGVLFAVIVIISIGYPMLRGVL